MRTVQGEVEGALGRILGLSVIDSTGAGRTDAGVHALGQVMTVPGVDEQLDLDRAVHSLNGMLEPSIAISSLSRAPADFSARFSARSRTYVYAILASEVPDPWLASTALWHRRPLDVEAMNEAAGHLLGLMDFASFGRVDEGQSSERNLFELRASRSGSLIRIRARADGFIQQMVRSLVGTLMYVGEGRRTPDDVIDILRRRDRAAAGPVAPAHGLCLVSVEYDSGWSLPR